jgi:hypothetical protein
MQTIMRDLTVDLGADRPGMLAKAMDVIGKAGVNVEGATEVAGTWHGVFKDAKDAATARRAVEAAGFSVKGEQDVVVTDVQDRPGAAAAIFRKVADAGINVEFAYLATNTRVVIGARDAQRVQKALG